MSGSLAMGGTLRHLRDLFHDGTTLGLGDDQLLARFATSRDQAAFEALVARHGPMVLATCRAVLRHDHDVEDAFQATFLVLARKAGSVRAGAALGGWLHRVAYRISIQAGAEERRRRRRETEASAMIPTAFTPTRGPAGPDPYLASVVHEEVDRLPEKHRLPVVLCDLEGLTYDQAAERLRWTVPTLRCRLAKARRQLQGRLTQRGITAGALGVALASTASGARAAVPTSLTRAAVSAATGGTTSIHAAALAAALIRSMIMTKLKLAGAGVLAAASLVSIGVVASGGWRSAPPAGAIPQAGASMKRPPAATAPVSTPPSAPAEAITVRGRVVDPAGKPVAGAAVRAAYLDRETDPVPETTSGPDGSFTLRVSPWRRNSARQAPGLMFPWVVASAPGHGPGWVSAVRTPGGPELAEVRLVEDGPPIEGRIVDLQGRPAAGARIRVEHLWFAPSGSLADWLERAKSSGVHGPWQGLSALPSSLETTAGPDGRFRLTGIGRDRMAELLVSAPTIATAQVYVANRDGQAIRSHDSDGPMAGAFWTTYYTRRFDYTAAPTRPIEGVIRDQDTGRPISGIVLRGMVFQEDSLAWAPGVEAKTDQEGHYRLTGLPMADYYRLFLEPGPGLPYTKATFRSPVAPAALAPLVFDMTVKRGVVVRGRVTDKATGKPVSGYVNAYTFHDNPHNDEYPGYRGSYGAYSHFGADGRYEVVTLPGRGLIACRSDLGRYRQGVGASDIKGYDPTRFGAGGFITQPNPCMVIDYHTVAEINPDPKAEVTTLDLQVDPGRSLEIQVVDPDGRPIEGTKATGLTDLYWNLEYGQGTSTVVVHGLDPSRPRRVTITHEARKLVGSVYLKGDESGSMTLRLGPWGVLTGRIVDDEGQPRPGLALNNLGGMLLRLPAEEGPLPGDNIAPGILVGPDGRFRIEGFAPGLRYSASASQGATYLGVAFRDAVLRPGEVKNLGDLKVVPPRPSN